MGLKMAIRKCKECGKEVSSTAKTCPHCGISNPGVRLVDYIKGFFIGIIVLFFITMFFALNDSDDPVEKSVTKPAKTKEQIAAENAECRKTLQCWGNKHNIEAVIVCEDVIEKLAQYGHKWTDGMLEPKLSHFRWKNKAKGHLIFSGDKIQFQNGFGAWKNYIYECDYDPGKKQVLDVRAQPGRL